MRKLSLHVSALNDAEYDLYTSSLNDIALADDPNDTTQTEHDDVYYEQMQIGVREARAWFRGRYSHISASNIDVILRNFSPNLGQSDAISGGQFFAAFRLVLHTEGGQEVDRALAFVQAHPNSIPSKPRLPSPKRTQSELPPLPPARRPNPTESPPATSPVTSTQESRSPVTNNPFTPTTDTHPQPPLHPLQRNDHTITSQHTAHNPFVNRNKVSSARSEDGSSKLPPLPPRKPPPPVPHAHHSHHPTTVLVPPPRHAASQLPPARPISPHKPAVHTPTLISPFNTGATMGPLVPPPKLAPHITSTLMKQSLQASKAAQKMKTAEEQLEKERVLQVLKSSSVVSGSFSMGNASVTGSSVVIGSNIRNRSSSPTRYVYAASATSSQTSGSDERIAPPLPRRRTQQQHPSPPTSASSMAEVAFAAPPQHVSPMTHGGSHTAFGRDNMNHGYLQNSPFRSPVDPTNAISSMSRTSSPSRSPARDNINLPSGRPPTHPDRKPTYLNQFPPSPFSTPSAAHSGTTNDSSYPHTSDSDSFEMVYGPNTPTISAPTPSSVTPGSVDSPTARVFRSKSMHYPSPPPVPPPLTRRRPESVQVLGSDVANAFKGPPRSAGFSDSAAGNRPGSNLSRHSSMSVPSSAHRRDFSASHSHAGSTFSDSSPLTNIQRTLASLQPKLDALQLQPRLDKARYKAEAGLSKRGFVRDRVGTKSEVEGQEEEGLMESSGSTAESARGRGRDQWIGSRSGRSVVYDEPQVDRDGMVLNGSARAGRDSDGEGDQWVGIEQDNLKWPAGEGWKPLS